MEKIIFLRPTIFPFASINSGITLANYQVGKFGFSAYKTDAFTEDEVIKNRNILATNIGVSIGSLIFQEQVHTTNIQVITKPNHPILKSDGLITNKKGIVLCINLADCGGVLCYDAKHNTIGAFHSGWKGTKLNIVKVGIEKMREVYFTEPADLLVYLTPCAGKENYEVENDVAQYFPNHITQTSNDNYLLDLKGEIVEQLINLGVSKENIEVSFVCTISNNMYHSFRRDGEKSGRMTAFIMLK
jgi:YfiH family protein